MSARPRGQERSPSTPRTRSGPLPGAAELREQFRDAMRAERLVPPDVIEPGRWYPMAARNSQ
jgi:hypothetical protein